MSSKELIKESLLLKLPEGALRQLEPGGDEDRLWDGIAEAIVPAYESMRSLADLREPDSTEELASLEREYGFLADSNLSEDERRGRIKALKYAKAGSGTAEAMQEALTLAGFDLVVVEGRQSQDPAIYASGPGEYVVNGFEFLSATGYDIGCQQTAGSPDTPENATYEIGCNVTSDPFKPFDIGCLGLAEILTTVPYIPTDNFHLVFYVAEAITVNGSGYITSLTPAVINRKYRQVIREIILRLKPLHTWGYLAVDWESAVPGVDLWGFGFFPMGITPHGL